MERAALPEWSPDTPAKEKLIDFITTFMRRIRSEPDDTWHTKLMMREIMQPTEACAELVHASIRPQSEIILSILRELLPPGTSQRTLQLTAFSIVGQCLFYHFADPVIRNLVGPAEYDSYGVEALARHIGAFSLAALNNFGNASTRPQARSRRTVR
jgi:hypothetical protein